MAQHYSGVRLCQVNNSHGNESGLDADIIAIHGLDTKSPDTWTWKSKIEGNKDVNWLVDSDMLPREVGRSRIFTCEWPANIFRKSTSIPMTIKELGRLLIESILGMREQTNDERPILFIASCLGGLILMEALLVADRHRDTYGSLRKATRGAIFLATPFRGTSFQDIAYWSVPLLKGWASLQDAQVTTLLDSVKDSSEIEELKLSFTQMCQDRLYPFEVCNFYETEKTLLLRKVLPAWVWGILPQDVFCEAKLLVSRGSATLDIVPNPLPLDGRTHVKMNKFEGPDDPSYRLVVGKISKIIQNKSLLQQADAWIRDICYAPGYLQIERLSGDLLPMDQCYINLAILENCNENENKSEMKHQKAGSSPFSLLSRLRVEGMSEDGQVSLSDLFSPHNNGSDSNNASKARPRRILIRGRAGVGKTTLCKKIVHDFVYHDMWHKIFDRLLWVPLRKLKSRDAQGYNLEKLLMHEYFSQSENGVTFAEGMRHAIDRDAGKTLFILDGLDEVSRHLDEDDPMFPFLQVLLNQPNVIITSRPSGIPGSRLHALDLTLETVGFDQFQIDDYLEKTFIDKRKAIEIQGFLQNRQLLEGLVRIPVQLDALCFAWGEGFSSGTETMTNLYQAIEQRLWKKDILRLGKKHDGHLLKRPEVRDLAPWEVEYLVDAEIKFLEYFAFIGLYNDVVDFELKHRNTIFKQLATSNLTLALPHLSFLRTSEPSQDDKYRNYHFIHLTYQEYFAARYFKRQWTSQKTLKCLNFSNGKIEQIGPAVFLRKHKYAPRYEILWRFVTGLLENNEALRFLEIIEGKPVDLLGPSHQRLIMHCLSEVHVTEAALYVPQPHDSFQTRFEEKLSRWMILGTGLRRFPTLLEEPECPEQAICTLFRDGRVSSVSRLELLKCLRFRRIITPTIAQSLYEYLRSPYFPQLPTPIWDDCELRATASVLCRCSTLPPEVLGFVTETLTPQSQRRHDIFPQELAFEIMLTQHETVQNQLYMSLMRQVDDLSRFTTSVVGLLGLVSAHEVGKIDERVVECLSISDHLDPVGLISSDGCFAEETLTAVATCLGIHSQSITTNATQILSRHTHLPEPVINIIAAHLQDENPTSGNALDILRRQQALPERVLKSIVERLGDESKVIRDKAILALQKLSPLPPNTIKAMAKRVRDSSSVYNLGVLIVWRGQPDLPEETMQLLMELVGNEDEEIMNQALRNLFHKSFLPAHITQGLVERLRDSEKSFKLALIQDGLALQGWQSMPGSIRDMIINLFEDEDETMRMEAICAVGRQRLPVGVLMILVKCLKDSNTRIKSAALSRLRFQVLPDDVLIAVADLLSDSKVRASAFELLCSSRDLPKQVVATVVGFVSGEKTQNGVMLVLSRQNSLPNEVVRLMSPFFAGLDAKSIRKMPSWVWANVFKYSTLTGELLEILKDLLSDDFPQDNCLRPLKVYGTLPMDYLEAVVPWLESSSMGNRREAEKVLRRHKEFYSALINRRYIKSLYPIWLRRSFKEQMSLFIDGDTLFVNMPEGSYEIQLGEDGFLDEFWKVRAEILGEFGLDS